MTSVQFLRCRSLRINLSTVGPPPTHTSEMCLVSVVLLVSGLKIEASVTRAWVRGVRVYTGDLYLFEYQLNVMDATMTYYVS